ncbi:MAG: histidine ammonia-lyase, partial [Endozoicomonas sp.]
MCIRDRAQGVDLRKPWKTSETLQAVMKTVRKDVPFYDQDRYFFPDIQNASQLVASGQLNVYMPAGLLVSLG